MVMARKCKALNERGQPCGAYPMHDDDYCFSHSPEHAEEAAEARRLGGLRRRRERAVEGAFDFDGLDSVAAVRRVLEIAIIDTLGLENSIARSRTLAYLGQVSLKVLEVGDLDQRIAALEAALKREQPDAGVFDDAAEGTDYVFEEAQE